MYSARTGFKVFCAMMLFGPFLPAYFFSVVTYEEAVIGAILGVCGAVTGMMAGGIGVLVAVASFILILVIPLTIYPATILLPLAAVGGWIHKHFIAVEDACAHNNEEERKVDRQ